MAIEEKFPSNSNRSHNNKLPAQNKVQPVVESGVKKQDITKHSFFADDMHDVGSYLLMDVLVPAAKSLLYDLGSKGLSMVLWGEDKSPRRSSSGMRINYNEASSRGAQNDRPRARLRTAYDYQDLLFDTRADAERVLEEMCDIFDRNDYVSVGDMYDLANQQTMQTDFDYGWTDLRTAQVRASGDGYYIQMPRIEQLKRR